MNTTLPSLALPALPMDTSAAATYTNLNGLAALKRDPTSPQAITAVAAQVEALFLQMMLKSMREATASDDPDSNEMGMYQDMFDKQVALTISQHDDLGIGAMLKRQLSNKTAPAAAKEGSAEIPGGAPPMAQTPAQFVDHVMPSIRRAAASLGVNPMGLLAQAALETGWGQRMPRNADGSSSLNLFGIKAGDEWSGARATADSVEFNNGVASPRRSVFRAYGSIEESVSDFANLLKHSPRYRDAVASGADSQKYVDSIGKSGYATDPDYANKLNQILNSGALHAALIPRTAAL
ncbi:MAG: glucosaminidase domain-containing protein [Gammaproteobacteria bacterium]